MTTLEKFYQGDIRALSRIISFIENRKPDYRDLLGRLYEKAGQALRIGLTGPPGAGKSTLVNGLIHEYLKIPKRVGVIAVDPTSPFTGGALLGDRIRMNEFSTTGEVYFRSMATRGASGGLASATGNVAVAMDAFGFDIILIETVGVGQVELDIIDTCDVVVVTIVPESGDAVQTMKAGLMEIADVFVVNKADRPGAEKLAMNLKQTIQTKKKKDDDWEIPIIQTVAINKKNIDLLFDKINEYISFIKNTGIFSAHRQQQIRKKILSILSNRFRIEFINGLEGKVNFDKIVDDILKGKSNPYEVSEEMYQQFKKIN